MPGPNGQCEALQWLAFVCDVCVCVCVWRHLLMMLSICIDVFILSVFLAISIVFLDELRPVCLKSPNTPCVSDVFACGERAHTWLPVPRRRPQRALLFQSTL